MRRSCTVADAAAVAAEVRALVPAGESVADAVREIVEGVRARGDAAVAEYERRFGGRGRPVGGAVGSDRFRVPPAALAAALSGLDPAVRAGLEVAAANVEAVAAAGLDAESLAVLEQGQSVRLREVPVARAAVYAPGGRAPYPSSVVMGAVTARAAGVDRSWWPRRRTRSCSPPPRCAGPTRSTRWAARRRSPRSRSGPRACRAWT